jgi:hypothetical protein
MRWLEGCWPMGAIGAGALAAGEAFKVVMQRLSRFARAPEAFHELFAFSMRVHIKLASERAPRAIDLGRLDIISGGAIAQAALFCFARIPDIEGLARIIEYTNTDQSNLNRYALMRGSQVGESKLRLLKSTDLAALRVTTCTARLEQETMHRVGTLAPAVLVGVDHIPTRWFVQAQQPEWLGIGASTHWNAMSSFHTTESACARCLHAQNDTADRLIPTVAFVSLWAGLLLASQFARHAGGEDLNVREQQLFLTPPRPESIWKTSVHLRPDCPVCRMWRRTKLTRVG